MHSDLYGNERFCFHGTSRTCNIGSHGHTELCSSVSCRLCSIIKTSFGASLQSVDGACVPTFNFIPQALLLLIALGKEYIHPLHLTSVCLLQSTLNCPDASFRAASYGPQGMMLLTKVVLGRIHTVHAFGEVMAPPVETDSVRSQHSAMGKLI